MKKPNNTGTLTSCKNYQFNTPGRNYIQSPDWYSVFQ